MASRSNKRFILGLLLASAVAVFAVSFMYRMDHPSNVMELKQPAAGRQDPNMDKLRSLMQSLSENPDDPQVQLELGRAFMAMQAPQRALGFLAKAGELDPANPEVPQAMGMAYFQMEDFPNAIASFEKAAAMNPDEPGPEFNLGMLKKHYMNATEEGNAHFRKVLDMPGHEELKQRAKQELGEE